VGFYERVKAALPAEVRRALLSGLRHLPRNRAGDFVHALAKFVHAHHRLPRSGSFSSTT